jgi:hypothetical protein
MPPPTPNRGVSSVFPDHKARFSKAPTTLLHKKNWTFYPLPPLARETDNTSHVNLSAKAEGGSFEAAIYGPCVS